MSTIQFKTEPLPDGHKTLVTLIASDNCLPSVTMVAEVDVFLEKDPDIMSSVPVARDQWVMDNEEASIVVLRLTGRTLSDMREING